MIIKDPNYAHEYYGMSTDTKPLSVPNASLFYEIDTCDIYMFDEDGKQWFKQSGGSGSSGGSSGGGSSDSQGGSSASTANIMIIRPANVDRQETTDSDHESGDLHVLVHTQVTYDKTWQEVHDALVTGVPVYLDATAIALARMEGRYFQALGNGDVTGDAAPTLAKFEEIRANTTVMVPVTVAFKLPAPDADGISFYVSGFTVLYNMDGAFVGLAASSNASLTDGYVATYTAPEDYQEEQQAETGEG